MSDQPKQADPAERAKYIRDELAKQRAKMPTVDNNGHPIGDDGNPLPREQGGAWFQ